MYKCSECGQEFKIKPDYCDCGNDIFLEIQEDIKPKKQKVKKSFSEQYPWFDDLKASLDPLSVGIFFLCCILSICLIVFAKPTPKTDSNEMSIEKGIKQNTAVSDIDTFWNDTPPKMEIKKVITVPTQPENKQKEIISMPPAKNIISKVTPVKQPAKQTTQTKKTNNKIQNTKTNVVKTQTNQQTQNQKTRTTSTPPTQKTQQTTPPKAPLTTQQIKPVKTTSQELKTYKNGLRNSITSKINFENVYGNGTCEVTFSVNSNGKLINRKFAKQSNDGTLNEEVYEAIMSTPKYQTPPSSYNGEVLHYVVKMKNGNYSATIY